MSKKRTATVKRKTKETEISLTLNLDGSGKNSINTGIGFFDHMLDLFSTHGLFDLSVSVKGDLEIDGHHSVEDVGICLGEAFRTALGDARGINRYASGLYPMDEALCQIALDISNRPHLTFKADFAKTSVGTFDTELVEEFFNAFVNNGRITCHISYLYGQNLHHMIEGSFKGFGQCLDWATCINPRKKDVPSTKGVL